MSVFNNLCRPYMHAGALKHKEDWVSEKVRYMSKVLHRGSQFYNRNNCSEVIDILRIEIQLNMKFPFSSQIYRQDPVKSAKVVFL